MVIGLLVIGLLVTGSWRPAFILLALAFSFAEVLTKEKMAARCYGG